MKHFILLATTGIAAVLHVFFGWPFSVIGAIIAGAWYAERPVFGGMSTLVLSWGGMMAYTALTAPAETASLLETMGSLFGDIPGFMIVVITLLIAAVLGGLGGWIGMRTKTQN